MSPRADFGWLVRLLTVAALGVDAGVHADLAPTRPPSSGISQTDLFWFETVVAILAAVLVLVAASRLFYVFAFLVAVTALGAVVLYRYVDVGSLGPLPDMYEPFWFTGKVVTTVAETVAVLGAGVGFLVADTDGRRPLLLRATGRRNAEARR